jgi:hypothetical protein
VAKQWRVGIDVENSGQRGGGDFRLESIQIKTILKSLL